MNTVDFQALPCSSVALFDGQQKVQDDVVPNVCYTFERLKGITRCLLAIRISDLHHETVAT